MAVFTGSQLVEHLACVANFFPNESKVCIIIDNVIWNN